MVTATIGKKIQIPCIINRASLGDAEYVFVIIENSINNPRKVAWVPREDITIQTQPLSGIELNAQLSVDVVGENGSNIFVAIKNDGIEETLKIEKDVLK